jgi:hypothetical protein
VAFDRAGNVYVADGFSARNKKPHIAKFKQDSEPGVKGQGPDGARPRPVHERSAALRATRGQHLRRRTPATKRIQVFDGERNVHVADHEHRHARRPSAISGGATQVLVQLELQATIPKSLDNGEIYKILRWPARSSASSGKPESS